MAVEIVKAMAVIRDVGGGNRDGKGNASVGKDG